MNCRPTRLSKNLLFEKFSQKSPTTGSKIAKMMLGTQKQGAFQCFCPTFQRSVFEKGLFRQFQWFALPASGRAWTMFEM